MNKFEKIHYKTLQDIADDKRISPLKAIRLKCLECVCWQVAEVKLCPSDDCMLWRFRFGKNTTGGGRKRGSGKVLNIKSGVGKRLMRAVE